MTKHAISQEEMKDIHNKKTKELQDLYKKPYYLHLTSKQVYEIDSQPKPQQFEMKLRCLLYPDKASYRKYSLISKAVAGVEIVLNAGSYEETMQLLGVVCKTSGEMKQAALNQSMELIIHEDDTAYREAKHSYSSLESIIYDEFKQWLFKENGVETNPKRFLAFSKAWDRGHSTGLESVAAAFEDLVSLIAEEV
jgi:hypothetical protein